MSSGVLQERVAELAPLLVPGRDPAGRFLVQRPWLQADLDRVGVRAVVRYPVLGVRRAHLRVELDAPGVVAHAVGLEADGAAGQESGAGGQRALIAVPLEGGEAIGEGAEDRIRLAGARELDVEPADLRLGRASDLGAGGRGEHLGAQADA